MIAIRFHGRGGQGTVVASKLLAVALFHEGWQVQAFPAFGPERSGAPVTAFLRADHRPITAHYQVYEPHYVVVLDPVLLATTPVTAGLVEGGSMLINTPRPAGALGLPPSFRVVTIDATAIALRHGLGSRTRPIVNTAIAGAFAAATDLVPLAPLLEAIDEVVPMDRQANRDAAREAFDVCRQRVTACAAG